MPTLGKHKCDPTSKEIIFLSFNNINFNNQKVLQEQVEQLKTKLQQIKEKN